MKYEWMAFKTRTAESLEADVGKILDGFGSDCRMTFLLTKVDPGVKTKKAPFFKLYL
jgi:hypothetical protein